VDKVRERAWDLHLVPGSRKGRKTDSKYCKGKGTVGWDHSALEVQSIDQYHE
jgi:hypothetical protein